jgi:tetrapyrrole methylase family protein/MazG family protein
LWSNRAGSYNPTMSTSEYSPQDLRGFETLISILQRLRAPGGCPWDREQTHASLKRNLLEESYEVLEAIDRDDPKGLAEELGDLLVQVGFHGQIAQESGDFDLGDVLTLANEKLVRRHPHVFGDATAADAREVERNWEKIKEAEREQQGQRKSPVEGIPKDLPSLAVAQLMQDRVGRSGFEWDDISGVLDKVAEEVEELRQAETLEEKVHELGDLFFVMVNLARWLGIHAEDALRLANQRFQWRYLKMEELAGSRGLDFAGLPLSEKEELWQEAKALESHL